MSIQQINNGDTGLKARNALNTIGQAAQIAMSGRTATIMGFGDSFAGTTEIGGGYLTSAILWARHYWEPGLDVRMVPGFNVGGVQSTNLPTQFANYAASVASGGIVPDIAVLSVFQNDGGNLATDYTNRMNITKTFIQNLLNSGIKLVIVCTLAPPMNMIKEIANADLAQFVENTPGTALCDLYSQLINPAAPQGQTGAAAWRTANGASFTVDATHPSLEGCKYWGSVLADILRPICRRIVPRIASNEVFSSGNATLRYANAVRPGNMNGNFGQLNGVDDTGVAGFAANADSRWRIVTANGVVVTPSVITTPDGIRRQRMVLSGTVGGGSQGTLTLEYAPGFLPLNGSSPQYGQAVIDFNNVVGLTVLSGSSLNLPLDANGSNTQPALDTLTGRYFAWRNYTSPADGNAGFRGVSFRFLAGATISGTIDVGQCGLWLKTPYVP